MRKLSANYIYSPHTGFLKNAILILDDENTVIELKENKNPNIEEAGTEFYNGIICPGFINAHCHIELSHMHKKIPEGVGLDNFIKAVVTSRKSNQEEIDLAITRADDEMKREGIVAQGPIPINEVRIVSAAGLRAAAEWHRSGKRLLSPRFGIEPPGARPAGVVPGAQKGSPGRALPQSVSVPEELPLL